MDIPLLLLAAGRSTRFGSLKQVAPVGPGGASILTYTVADALHVGFSEVVVVVRPEIESTVRGHLDAHLGPGLPIRYALQREPHGTGHAALVGLYGLDGPAALANGDDAYGRDGLRLLLGAATRRLSPEASGVVPCALVAYAIRSTLSDHGGVSRGWVQTSGETVTTIDEMRQIVLAPEANGLVGETASGEKRALPLDALGSMNLWVLGAGLEPRLARAFEQHRRDEPDAEFALPTALSALQASGEVAIRVAGEAEGWFGLTFAADLPAARERLAEAHRRGLYPDVLATMVDSYR